MMIHILSVVPTTTRRIHQVPRITTTTMTIPVIITLKYGIWKGNNRYHHHHHQINQNLFVMGSFLARMNKQIVPLVRMVLL
jgi:hypothetical protein